MPVTISRFLSQKFRFYTFTCIALLLFVHGYNLNNGYLTPSTMVYEPLTFTTFFEYFIANGILRFRIPMLFIISGYIYAIKDKVPYGERIRKRAGSLLVPYLVWSAIALCITWLWQQHPVTARAVFESNIDQLNDNRPYEEIGWSGVLYRWVRTPVAYQLWFILALFMYNALYPGIKWAITRYPILWFVFLFIFWVSGFSFFVIDGRGLLFFSVGVLLQKTNVNLEKKPQWLSMYIAWLLFIGFSVIKTFMAFELDPDSRVTYWALTILYNVSILAGIVAIWFGADKVVKWCMRRPLFVWASAFSFFIFGLHCPLVVYLNHLFHIYFADFPYHRLLAYVTIPVLLLLFCILTGSLLRRLLPGFYHFATGGRGFGATV